jgi:cytochrome c oxidase cbb3-type subunit 3
MAQKEIDRISGTETTGHEWDGIKELNTPLPRWWLWTFYATIIWAVGYCIAYPAVPLIREATNGLLGYSSRADLTDQMAAAKLAQSQYLERIAKLAPEEIRTDQELFQFAVAGGRSAFKVYCSQCHGTGAAGSRSYPNLNDDDWLWGGKLEDIHTTLKDGVRFAANEATRTSLMPAFGADGVLKRDEIAQVTEFVLQLSGQEHDQAAAEKGKTFYADNCAACHGDAGQGDRAQGAPKLTDGIWLYSGDRESIAAQIWKPNHGVMPAWGQRLDDATLKQLAVYVYSLGGGE